MSDWNLEGKRVYGFYLNKEEYACLGGVIDSRVCYGGTVRHVVKLDTPINVMGEVRDMVTLKHSDIMVIIHN